MNQYLEPWRAEQDTMNSIEVIDSAGKVSACVMADNEIEREDDARAARIVACVNALAGIPDEELDGLDVKGLLAFLKREADGSTPGLNYECGRYDCAIEALRVARGEKGGE